jgi:hypothetical protein
MESNMEKCFMEEQILIAVGFPQGKYEVTKIVDNEELSVYLESPNAKINVSFGDSVLSYHKFDEECDYARVDILMTYLKRENIDKYTLYQVINSSLIKKIVNQPLNLLDENLIIHYLIVSSNCLIDIITMDEYSIEVEVSEN